MCKQVADPLLLHAPLSIFPSQLEPNRRMTQCAALPWCVQVVCANLLFRSWARRAQPTVDMAIASADALSA